MPRCFLRVASPGSVARPCSAAKPGDGTARRCLGARALGAGPGRRGPGGRARKRPRQLRAGTAAERRAGECGGPAGGRAATGRAGERARETGARRSARPGTGAVAKAVAAPASSGRARPSGPSPPASPGTPRRVPARSTPPTPPPRVAPVWAQPLRAAATPPAPRHARAIVSPRPARRDSPSPRRARPSACSARLAAASPALPAHWRQPPPRLRGRHPFTELCLVFFPFFTGRCRASPGPPWGQPSGPPRPGAAQPWVGGPVDGPWENPEKSPA